MGGIYIPNMEMPSENEEIGFVIKSDGSIHYQFDLKCRTIATAIPAADVRPVVKGKWEDRTVFEAKGCVEELQSAFCPICKRYHTTPFSYGFTDYKFCPNCGADMRGEKA